MGYRIAVLPGDGIGPEVVAQAVKVLELVLEGYSVDLEREEIPCGASYFQETGKEWPEGAFERCRGADAILLGAVGGSDVLMPSGLTPASSVIFGLRSGLDLYANVRPVRLLPGVTQELSGKRARVWNDVDLTIVRESTEGLYAPVRGTLKRGGLEELAVDDRVITRKGSERVIRFAFELARKRGRGGGGGGGRSKSRVTCVDKSNVLAGCRLFRKVFGEVSAGYPDIEPDRAYVDAFAQWLMRTPEHYDVVVTTNLFGDILSDLAAVLQGGMGMAPSGSFGDGHALFEPVHGTAPDIAGKDLANPVAAVLSAAMMLDWLGERHGSNALARASADVERAVVNVLMEGRVLTRDLGGSAGCREMGRAIGRELDDILARRGGVESKV